MIDIVGHPGLETQVGDFSDSGPAVQEGLVHPSHFCDVGIQGYQPSVGQDELEMFIRIFRKESVEVGCFHGRVGFMEGLGKLL